MHEGQCPRVTNRRNFIESLLGIKIPPAGCVEGRRGGRESRNRRTSRGEREQGAGRIG